ncbi:hypothetical protein PSCLAVI8L_130765 [Pseudoclavibacter sp. 8L]|nr:hypothetical protein PSCLAVI8L_130765 [Pseudoclavibacter sp. 8L]
MARPNAASHDRAVPHRRLLRGSRRAAARPATWHRRHRDLARPASPERRGRRRHDSAGGCRRRRLALRGTGQEDRSESRRCHRDDVAVRVDGRGPGRALRQGRRVGRRGAPQRGGRRRCPARRGASEPDAPRVRRRRHSPAADGARGACGRGPPACSGCPPRSASRPQRSKASGLARLGSRARSCLGRVTGAPTTRIRLGSGGLGVERHWADDRCGWQRARSPARSRGAPGRGGCCCPGREGRGARSRRSGIHGGRLRRCRLVLGEEGITDDAARVVLARIELPPVDIGEIVAHLLFHARLRVRGRATKPLDRISETLGSFRELVGTDDEGRDNADQQQLLKRQPKHRPIIGSGMRRRLTPRGQNPDAGIGLRDLARR